MATQVVRTIEETHRVDLDEQGYDDGGHYWGTGQPLWCVYYTEDGSDKDRFVRAPTQARAEEKVRNGED